MKTTHQQFEEINNSNAAYMSYIKEALAKALEADDYELAHVLQQKLKQTQKKDEKTKINQFIFCIKAT